MWRFSHKFVLRSQQLSNYDVVVRIKNCDRFVSEAASGLGGIEIPLEALVCVRACVRVRARVRCAVAPRFFVAINQS